MDTIDPLYGVRQLQKLQLAFEVRGAPLTSWCSGRVSPQGQGGRIGEGVAGQSHLMAVYAAGLLLMCCGQAADEDGSGELEMKEFMEKLGPLIGSEENMTMKEVGKLFMKIDADSNGGVDWCVSEL